MNPKGGNDSPRQAASKGGNNGGRSDDHSDGSGGEESGLSDDEEEEEEEEAAAAGNAASSSSASAAAAAAAASDASTDGLGVGRRKRGVVVDNSSPARRHDEDEEGDGDEDTSEDEEDGGGEEDEEDEEEEEEGEDSSDMDVQECEKKRFEFIDDLTDLEKQFAILREQLYRERITQIAAKLAEVKSGKAPEYLQPLEELESMRKNRLEVSAVLRELRMANIQCKHDAEMLATEQNFLSEKELLWDSIKADLEEKIHMLEEDKHNVDFSSGLWEQNSGKSRKRKADALDPDRRKKPVTVTGPYIVYMLHEGDILDDWSIIKKSMTQRKKT